MKARYKKSDAVKELENLAYKAKISRFPDFPYPVKDKYRDDTANGLTRCIIDFVNLNGYQAERLNSTGRQVTIKGRERWIKGSGTKGTADISATINGRAVKIEVKIGRDRQSEVQKEYQKQIERAGGMYIIARDFEQFYKWYREFMKG